MKSLFSAWLEYKYRVRKIYSKEKRLVAKAKPDKYDDNLVFSTRFYYDDNNNIILTPRRLCDNESDHIKHIYTTLVLDFNRLIKRLNVGYESTTKRRHIYTFHSLRRWVKSTLADLISTDFSEWAIGHAGTYSTYYRKSESEKYQLFLKAESSLTYLDQTALTREHSDLQSRLEHIEDENIELKKNINKIMEMIQQNPTLANVKPEVLINKK